MRFSLLGKLAVTAGILVLAFSAAHAQSLNPGVVNLPVNTTACPHGFAGNATCYYSTVSCPDVTGVPNIDFYYALTPVPTGTQQIGTIVFFNGGNGDGIGFSQFVPLYTSKGFQTIQVEWGTTAVGGGEAWEKLGSPLT